jgi:hypothetical protein
VTAWGRFVWVAAAVMLLALSAVPGAPASTRAHRRHVEVREPHSSAMLYLGERDGYEIALRLEEPDEAILYVATFEDDTEAATTTAYGAHFRGSLPFGTLRARFGAVGSVAVRFRPGGKARSHRLPQNCTGRRPRGETGAFVGRISLHGEGGYFRVSTRHAVGSRSRSFRVRCRVRGTRTVYPPPSLRDAVEPSLSFGFGSGGGSVAMLEAYEREGGREVFWRAAHMEEAKPGAELEAGAFEYQGKMPVGRTAYAPEAPAGTLLTTLPGERPPTATLKPPAPFLGEAEYVGTAPTSHSLTGSLAVQFPGLLQPLAGPGFASSLCVLSPLRDPDGCDFKPPDWQVAEGSAGAARGIR